MADSFFQEAGRSTMVWGRGGEGRGGEERRLSLLYTKCPVQYYVYTLLHCTKT